MTANVALPDPGEASNVAGTSAALGVPLVA
jgi:hypothetical protein